MNGKVKSIRGHLYAVHTTHISDPCDRASRESHYSPSPLAESRHGGLYVLLMFFLFIFNDSC